MLYDKSKTCGRKRAGEQQRGARGQQHEPEWTVTRAEREGEERTMSRAAPQRWVGRSGGFRKTRE